MKRSPQERADHWSACVAIVILALGLPILLAGGWPLTLLFGGGK